jgi:site-specific DNA-cytosine methylase
MQTERAAYNANKGKILQAVADLKENEFIRLRSLTPRESLRMMDLEDQDIDKMLKAVPVDQIFRQSGNSIVISCLYHLFRKLFVDLEEDPGDSKQLF